MRIVVCLKQVPDESSIKFDDRGNLIRDGVKLINNIYDNYALENALILKDKYGFKITAITMGIPQSLEVIKDAIARGCDDGYVITDKRLKGSDVLITSKVLSMAVKKICNLDEYAIFTGVKSQDGETAIVPSEISRFLKIPAITGVSEIDFKEGKFLVIKHHFTENLIFEIQFKSCISFEISNRKLRMPSLKNKIKANSIKIPVLSVSDLGIDIDGLRDSPTRTIDFVKIKNQLLKSTKEINLEKEEDLKELKKIIYE